MTAPPVPPENARLEPLIGTWRTQGEVLGDDGVSPVASVDGTDAYEWLGPFFVVHRIEVAMAGEQVLGLEMIGPYDPDLDAFPTTAYDHQGAVSVSTATADGDGTWTFGADDAKATLRGDPDGRTLHAEWVRSDDGGASWRPWMNLRLSRVS